MLTNEAWLRELFPGKTDGYFVEAGAHDGVGDSQTKWLEDLGWRGICVEPSSYYTGLEQSRNCALDNRVLWNRDLDRVPFMEVTDTELSGVTECFGDHWDRVGRPHTTSHKLTVMLTSLLVCHGAPSVIEYLALDTEGSELLILQAHDFERFRFLAMTVEHNGVGARRRALREFLATQGYAPDPRATGVDDLFRWQGFC